MNIIAIIPARYASTRLPGKPLAEIGGKPMIRHVVERTQAASLVTSIVVATDDARVEAAVKAFGGAVVMTSPDLRSGSDRIASVARGLDADIVVNVQGDEPLIDPKLIDETIRLLIDDGTVQVGTAVKAITEYRDIANPSVVKAVLDKDGFALYFSRSPIPFARDATTEKDWLARPVHYKHFGLYVYRADFLQLFTALPPSRLEQAEQLEQLRILEYGHRIKCTVTQYDSFPVDTPDDLAYVRHHIQSKG